MSIARPFSILLTLSSLVACGASEPPSSEPPAVQAPQMKSSAQKGEGYDTCVAVFRRQRDCTDAYIPALVDARVRADVPAGIAGKDKELGRDALVAGALEEWESDSTDQAIDATCTSITDDQAAGAPELIQKAEACLSESECAAFSACAVDIAASRW